MPRSMSLSGGATVGSSAAAGGCFTAPGRTQRIVPSSAAYLANLYAKLKTPVGDAQERASAPLLMVDIDGVISLFGGWEQAGWERAGEPSGRSTGSFHSIDGTPHFLSSTAAAHLLELSSLFELVWASGWEERANEHLPHLLGLPRRAAVPALRARGRPRQRPLEARRDRRVRRRARAGVGRRRAQRRLPRVGAAARGADAARADRSAAGPDGARGGAAGGLGAGLPDAPSM